MDLQWNKFENGISLHPIEERIELYTNLERNFRFTMINRLSEIIDEAEKFNPTTQVKPADVAKMSMRAVGYDKFRRKHRNDLCVLRCGI